MWSLQTSVTCLFKDWQRTITYLDDDILILRDDGDPLVSLEGCAFCGFSALQLLFRVQMTPQRPCTEFLREARGLLAIYGKRHKVACPQGSSLSDHSMSVFHGFLNIPQGCVTGEVIWTGGKHCLRRTWDWFSTNLVVVSKIFLFSPLPAKMIQFDEHIFQMAWFNPPTRHIRDCFVGLTMNRWDSLMLVRIKCLKQVPLWILSWLRDYGVSFSSKNPSYGEFNYIPKAGIFLARVHDVKLLKQQFQ